MLFAGLDFIAIGKTDINFHAKTDNGCGTGIVFQK
jgi:hypothetical protein